MQLDNVISTLKDAETGQRGYLITGDDTYLEPYKGAREKALQQLQLTRELTNDNPEQLHSCDVLQALIGQRMTVLQQAIELEKEKRTIDIEQLSKGKLYMDSVRTVISLMKGREEELLAHRTATMQRFAEYTPGLILIAALLALTITIFFYRRVSKDFDHRSQLQQALQAKDADITKRIEIIQDVANKIAAGDYAVRVADKGEDGLGNLAFSLNRMAASLEESFTRISDNEWQQSGSASLNEILIGEKNLYELMQDVMQFVAQYTNSQAGAMYLLEDKKLHFISGYAFMPAKERKEIEVGEGLVGQVAASKKEMLVSEVPEDAIYISHATGEIKPGNIIVFPLLDGRTVKGVIELASLQPYSARHQLLLQSMAHNIGAAVTRVENRRRLQELLEETQAQSEELQAQHSELESLNTELELQTQKLQASDEELRVQQEELLQANQELEERSHLLEERNRMIMERNQEIRQQAEQLALSTKYKSEFLANMSHELRTPLNSILLLSRLMLENKSENLNEDQVEYARVIQSSGQGLLSLIDEILDLSKIESGKMDLEFAPVSLPALINSMKMLFQPLANEKGLELEMALEEGAPDKIETDQLRLEQIVRNLLSNALKFTSEGSVQLRIGSITNKPDLVRISVTDTGIGIPPEKQQLVFEAFQQADGSTRRKYGGTGLGLSISRELARLLGGDIVLHSEPGKGSEFTLLLPVTGRKPENGTQEQLSLPGADPAGDPNEPETGREPKQDTVPQERDRYTSEVIPAPVPDDRNSITPQDKVILIIEDDTNFARSLLDFTRQKGYKGIIAVRGDEGVQLARRFKPLGILLDIQLPVKNGWEVMDDLKGDPQTRPIPVHIMSSFQVKNESLMKGAVDFINKPVAFEKMQEVFSKIEHVLSRHPKKVLIVEENAKHAQALAYFLGTFEMNLEVRNSVNDSVEALKKNEVDCVILDMGVPAKHAYETLDTVKKTKGLENIPIIVFTGNSLSQTEEMRIKRYADSIIVKTAHSYQRMLDEVSIFLHLVEEGGHQGPPRKTFRRLGAINEVLQQKKILIADDDVRNIFSLTKILESYKMTVLSAIDGREALKLLQENPDVDIVLMDMMMPEMDGYETTRHIRAQQRWKNLPVIALTAKAMSGDREKCMDAGASDYITKPVDMDQLLSLLRVWLYEKE
jgi:signal transduction histidine kinase/DNA-binding response OmpR family regulator/CHASE3 domain sensor protein